MKRRLLIAALAAVAVALAGCSSQSVGDQHKGDTSASAGSLSASGENPNAVGEAKKLVSDSLAAKSGFTPPSGGPKAQKPDAHIVYVASDLTNGGINAVGQGIAEASKIIGWTVTTLDGKASAQGRTEALSQAIAMKPAGIILGGFDAKEQAAIIQQATAAKIPVVSWHAGPQVGPISDAGVFANVTTDPLVVSKIAAAYAVADSNGTAGVQIFTDSQYEIAVAKAKEIEKDIKSCASCTVLSYDDSPIADANSRMPSLIATSLQQHGSKLTYLIGINGNYCGGAQSALQAAGISGDGPPKCVAAGDGDSAEFQRIRSHQFQSATVAEPVLLQGWQLVDELNRAMAGAQWSGFVAMPGLITADNVPSGELFDPASGYRDVYKANWGK